MANYNVTFSCGHAAEVSLYGKHAERDRKIAYFEKSGDCKACYIAKQKAADAAAPKIAHVKAYGLGNGPQLACRATGALDDNRAALEAIGFRWTDEALGFSDFLSTKRTMAFATTHKFVDSATARAWLDKLETQLATVGYLMKVDNDLLDGAFFRLALKDKLEAEAKAANVAAEQATKQAEAKAAEEVARQERLRAHPRPTRPEWYDVKMKAEGDKASWNGKVYGSPKRYKIYVNNVEYKITDLQKVEIEKYWIEWLAYCAAKK